MNLSHDLHLVDPIDGLDVPLIERFEGPEPDPTDAAEWPEWCDNWFWEPTDAAALAELEAAATAADADLADAPRPATQADRRAFQTDVVTFFATHPAE